LNASGESEQNLRWSKSKKRLMTSETRSFGSADECEILLLEGASGLSYTTFREMCLLPNRPALIRNAAAQFQVHPAVSTLTSSIITSMVDPFGHLLTSAGLTALFGDLSRKACPVYHCPVLKDGDDASCQPTTEEIVVTIQDVMTSWQRSEMNALPFHHPDRLYLMNWHFQQEAESALADRAASVSQFHRGDALYKIPEFLGFDLMHAYHLHCDRHNKNTSIPHPSASPPSAMPFGDGSSDYRFVYVGVEGTWTPLHHDVFGSFSWSLNLSGTKLWYFLTPESQKIAEGLWGPNGGPMSAPPPDVRVVANMTFDTVVQREGELVFVPSRWYHQVHNLVGAPYRITPHPRDAEGDLEVAPAPRVVCSINHNWMSFEQIHTMAALFTEEVKSLLRMTDKETRCAFTHEEWREVVDRMMLGSGAWNLSILRSFLEFVDVCVNSLEFGSSMCDADHQTQQWNDVCGGQQLLSLMSAEAISSFHSEWRGALSTATATLAECARLVERTDSVG
jgi:hypothetical protein